MYTPDKNLKFENNPMIQEAEKNKKKTTKMEENESIKMKAQFTEI